MANHSRRWTTLFGEKNVLFLSTMCSCVKLVSCHSGLSKTVRASSGTTKCIFPTLVHPSPYEQRANLIPKPFSVISGTFTCGTSHGSSVLIYQMVMMDGRLMMPHLKRQAMVGKFIFVKTDKATIKAQFIFSRCVKLTF